MRAPYLPIVFVAVTLLFTSAAITTRAEDGLYADISTSLGEITCRLEFELSPLTTANFVGLAEGTKSWLDQATGQLRTDPFFDGLIFHRVVSNFVIQSGSRNQMGSDGPGYEFRNEFHPSLTHDKPGILSMANSGRHSNGAQFFITVSASTFLDEFHSVFGEVVSGLDVVLAINHVVTIDERPLTNVVIHSVTIRREGAAAENFDASAFDLPYVEGVTSAISRHPQGGVVSFSFPRIANSKEWVYASSDLAEWQIFDIPLQRNLSFSTNRLNFDATPPELFFAASREVYPEPLYTPPSVQGTVITFFPQNSVFVWRMLLDVTNGWYVIFDSPTNVLHDGPIREYQWQQRPLTGRLNPLYLDSSTNRSQVDLEFTNGTSGVFSGRLNPGNLNIPFSGWFTMP